MEEYKTLRDECLLSIKTQHMTFRYSLAFLSALIAAGLILSQQADNRALSGFTLAVVVPFASYVLSIIWFGELARMVRAGSYIQEIEEKVSQTQINDDPRDMRSLNWEHHLRETTGLVTYQNKMNIIAAFGFYLSIGIGSAAFGLYFIAHPDFDIYKMGIFFTNLIVAGLTIAFVGIAGTNLR